MRILFTTIKSENLVNLNVVYQLEKKISQYAECKWSGIGWEDHISGETIEKTVHRLYGNDPPDWVIKNRANFHEYRKIGKNKDKSYKIVLTLGDLHRKPHEWVELMNKASDITLLRYLYSPYILKEYPLKFLNTYQRFDSNFYVENLISEYHHFPWFTDPKLYKPNNEKDWDVIFLGAYRKKVYPLRHAIISSLPKLCKEHKWRYLMKGRPPGKTSLRNIEDLLKKGYIVGDKYSEIISRSKIFIFGNSIFKYPLSKYFEIMGSGTLVMANKPQSSKELGFINEHNYVEINRNNWKEKLIYYLENESERERIAKNGYETAIKYHSTEIRAKQLISILKKADKQMGN